MAKGLEDKIPQHLLSQLYTELESRGFKKNEWLLQKGKGFVGEGHWCVRCNFENYSGIDIINKKNPSDKFSAAIDWVHTKECSDKNINDKEKLFVYWDYIGGDEKTARKYGVPLFSFAGGTPHWVLKNLRVIYK